MFRSLLCFKNLQWFYFARWTSLHHWAGHSRPSRIWPSQSFCPHQLLFPFKDLSLQPNQGPLYLLFSTYNLFFFFFLRFCLLVTWVAQSIKHLCSAQVMVSESWDQPPACALSLSNKWKKSLKKNLFDTEKENMQAQPGRRGRGRGRSRLPTARAWCKTWSQDPEIMTWAKGRRLTY